jgi:photosystem II stability/assembly factor-like uncharacterized protein
MRGSHSCKPFVFLLLTLGLYYEAKAAWVPVGPFGGDARALAADPRNPDHLYAGTATGQVYVSQDGGRQWSRVSTLSAPSNWVVDNLVVDPATSQVVYAGMWSLGSGGGGVFKSSDGGRTWPALEGIQGQSIRALTAAPSRSQTLVAGTLEGVFRSDDAGATWKRISPAGHAEIHSVESVAIDPSNPDIIYAGTWHLAWKTTDGGARWFPIRKGMIDDSDVFSIAIHPTNPKIVYATACSGIYRSDTAGAEWRKIQGIPTSSRRTHTLVLDPRDPEMLYAGTTEGLWRTPDGGKSWLRLTSHTWVINAIVLDPREPARFMLGMERAGIMETWDSGRTFRGANRGYSQRQVSRLITDPTNQERLFLSLIHDGEFGGVFTSDTRGATWQQLNAGLGGRDVLSLQAITEPEWRLLAGTPDGVFEYSFDHPTWKNQSRWEGLPGTAGKQGPALAVRDLYRRSSQEPIYAATSAGVFESSDGRNWKRLALPLSDGGVYAVASFGDSGENLLAAGSTRLAVSRDHGRNWMPVALDGDRPVRIHRIVPNPTLPHSVFIATEAGLFRSQDGGRSWVKGGRGLPASPVHDVVVSVANPSQVLLAGAPGAFYSVDGGDWFARLGEGPSTDGLAAGMNSLQILQDTSVIVVSPHNGLFVQDGRAFRLPRQPRFSQ